MAKKPQTDKPAPAPEERRISREVVEWRAAGDDDPGTISGYAAVVGQETVIESWVSWREKIAPGAFKAAIKTDDVRALFNHDPNILLGRTTSGTLRLKEDAHGLKYEVDLPDTVAAQDVRTLIERGDVTGSSFGFRVEEDSWDESEVKKGKLPLRTIERVSLFDVSPVTYPAYPTTSVSARSKAQTITETAGTAHRIATRAAIDQAKAWPS